MNNQQVIKSMGSNPKHPIHRIPPGATFHRWRTLTFVDPGLTKRTFIQFRQHLLDQLYQQWQDFHARVIEADL